MKDVEVHAEEDMDNESGFLHLFVKGSRSVSHSSSTGPFFIHCPLSCDVLVRV